jgi:uncharacterized protein
VGPPTAGGEPYGVGRYSDVARDRVYTRMREAAGTALGCGESVVLDASWSSESQRRAARALAAEMAADVVEIRCDAPRPVAERRLAARPSDDPSEATARVAARMRADFDPWPDAVVVPTTDDPASALALAQKAVGPH